MAGENTSTTLSALFKEQYARDIKDAKPKGLHVSDDVPFSKRDAMPGGTFHQPVSLTHEAGVTYETSGTDAFTLEAAVAHAVKDAQVLGTQVMQRARVGIEVAARAAAGGKQAFAQAFGVVVKNMNDTHHKRCEISHLYGQSGLAKIGAVNGTTGVITIDASHWADGIWAGHEGAKLVAATGILAASGLDGGTLTITAVNVVNRTITVSGTLTDVGDGDYLFFKTAKTGTAHKDYKGIHALLSATTGAVLNINVASYSLWKANTHAITSTAAGNLTFSEVNKAIAKAYGKGAEKDLVMYCNPKSWGALLDNEVALRRHNQGGVARYDVGAEGIQFYSQNGTIRIKSHRYVKEGFAYLISPEVWRRLGATDVTFNLPDRGDEFFLHIPDVAAYELRSYSNQAMFTNMLGCNTIITGILSP